MRDLKPQDIGPACDMTEAWDELRAELLKRPDMRLKSGIYRTNGGDWGLHIVGNKWPDYRVVGATIPKALRAASRLLRGESE